MTGFSVEDCVARLLHGYPVPHDDRTREAAIRRGSGRLRRAVYATKIAQFEIWLARALCGPSRDDLYEYRPNRAVEQDTALGFALEGHESFLEDVADSLHAAAKRRRKLRRTMAKLKEAIGADPVVVPEGETQMAASRSTRTLADAMPAAVAQLTYTS
jgi:hypothetical protein